MRKWSFVTREVIALHVLLLYMSAVTTIRLLTLVNFSSLCMQFLFTCSGI